MNFQHRIELYKQLEAKRGFPLIVYVTSQRPGATGVMSSDAIDEIIEQIESIPKDKKTVDLLIESRGGDGLTAWSIMSFLRERFDNVNVIIPHSAYSAATILSLGADEIIMGKYGVLGPIDPQITVTKKDGTTQQFAYEDIVAYLDFVKKEVGLTEQAHIESAFKLLCDTVEPPALGFATRASSLSVSIGEKLLQMHMSDAEQKANAGAIAKKLNKSFFSHGHSLSRKEAEHIGLNIKNPANEELEEIIWKIHKSFEKETNTKVPFNPISEFLADPVAGPYLQSPPPVVVPPQANGQRVMQILDAYIQNQLTAATPNVRLKIKFAFVESVRKASEFSAEYKILLIRTPDLKFIANAIELSKGWEEVPVPTPAAPTTPVSSHTPSSGALPGV